MRCFLLRRPQEKARAVDSISRFFRNFAPARPEDLAVNARSRRGHILRGPRHVPAGIRDEQARCDRRVARFGRDRPLEAGQRVH